MTVEPLVPDTADVQAEAAPVGGAFDAAVRVAGDAFERAARSEDAFAHGHGGLLAMVLDRAQADIVLSVATAAATRSAAALSAVFNLQV